MTQWCHIYRSVRRDVILVVLCAGRLDQIPHSCLSCNRNESASLQPHRPHTKGYSTNTHCCRSVGLCNTAMPSGTLGTAAVCLHALPLDGICSSNSSPGIAAAVHVDRVPHAACPGIAFMYDMLATYGPASPVLKPTRPSLFTVATAVLQPSVMSCAHTLQQKLHS